MIAIFDPHNRTASHEPSLCLTSGHYGPTLDCVDAKTGVWLATLLWFPRNSPVVNCGSAREALIAAGVATSWAAWDQDGRIVITPHRDAGEQREDEDSSTRSQELEAERAALSMAIYSRDQEIAQLRREKEDLQKTCEMLQRETRRLDAERERLQTSEAKEISALQQKLAATRILRDQAVAERRRAVEDGHVLIEERDGLRRELADADAALKMTTEDRDTLMERCKRLTALAACSQGMSGWREACQEQIKRQAATIDRQSADIGLLTRELSEARASHSVQPELFNAVVRERNEYRREVADLEKRVADAQKALGLTPRKTYYWSLPGFCIREWDAP